jgi:hypothetical protein
MTHGAAYPAVIATESPADLASREAERASAYEYASLSRPSKIECWRRVERYRQSIAETLRFLKPLKRRALSKTVR